MNRKRFLYIALSLLFVTSTIYAFYVSDLSNSYKGDNLNTISINVPIEWNDWSFTIDKVYKSRNEYQIASSISNSNLLLNINSVNKKWYIWVSIKNTSWDIKPYIFLVSPNDIVLNSEKGNYLPSYDITGFDKWTFNWAITDSETNDNSIKDTQMKIENQYISYDWKFYFQVFWNSIIKRNKNFEIINSYPINLGITWLNISNLTDIKSINSAIYLRFSNWNIIKGSLNSSGEYYFILEIYSYSDIWIENDKIISPLTINEDNILDYEIIWNYLYVLTTDKFKLFYIKNGDLTTKELIYSETNSNNLKSFILNNWIQLFDQNWKIFTINNDFQIYSITDESKYLYNGNSKIFSVVSSLNSDSDININASFLSKTAENIIKTIKYSTKDSKPLYNDNELIFNINKDEFENINITKTFWLIKFSSNYGNYTSVDKSFDFSIPLVGFGVKLATGNSDIDPELNFDINNINFKPYSISSWEYYIHLKAYDYYLNKSTEIIKWPIIIENDKPVLSSLSLLNNVNLNIKTWDTWNFTFKSNKLLDTLSLIIKDDQNNITVLNNTNVSYVKEYDWYKYSFEYQIQAGVKLINFNINWTDIWWNIWNIIYDYNLKSWWFQVLWVAETNAWISSNLSQEQIQKWFMFWVSSKNLLDNKINTDYKFNKSETLFNSIPIISSDWNRILDEKRLKYEFKEFKSRARKDIDINYFYTNWDINSPIKDISFLNKFYYLYKWNLELNDLFYEWNSLMIIDWNLDIKWNIYKNNQKETKEYMNNLKIYVTGDVNVYSNVSNIDSELIIWWTLNTLSSN